MRPDQIGKFNCVISALLRSTSLMISAPQRISLMLCPTSNPDVGLCYDLLACHVGTLSL